MAIEFKVVSGKKIVVDYDHTRYLAIHKKNCILDYIDKYDKKRNELVLDAGCGEPVIIQGLINRGKIVVGIDLRCPETQIITESQASFSLLRQIFNIFPSKRVFLIQ